MSYINGVNQKSVARTPTNIPVGIYVLKFSNRNTRTRCEIYSKVTIKIPERRQ